ncbi:head GIN domain-containing protein [Flavobacterium dauae]|uniref:head GIN domain-containing protein n=1 Tax=Flavobacterium dauae TaxID=1563479 RepID=UPI00101B2B0B|nr:head GIN domain-containing protein [Flavobacterium dauae]WLD23702.1 head GIN domain-containing protein [Flavobacterium dauae]
MKKHFFTTALLIGLQTITNAQVDKNVGDFTSLKASNRIKIELIPSTENKIVVKESQEDAVNIVNKNGRLVLKNTLKELVSENEYSVTIQVYFNNLKEVDAQGGSYIFSDAAIKQPAIELSANLGSTIKLNLETETLNANANTGAKLNLKGSASKSVKLSASSGGQITANELKTARNTVKVNSGSIAKVTATDYLDAQVLAGGKITIYGTPKDVKEKVTIGGSIEYVK